MNKATQLLSISLVISVLVIYMTSDDWTKSHATKVSEGKVMSVADGETLGAIINGEQEKISLAYVDCPGRKQAGGDAATIALVNAVEGQSVRFNIIDVDEHDRKVAEIFVNDQNINLFLVRTGHCYIDQAYAANKNDYIQAEDLAYKENLGVHKVASTN